MSKASEPRASASERCACTTIKKAARAMTRFYEESMTPAGVTATQFAILRALERNGPTPLSRLAEELVMDRTSLYRAVQPLLRDRLLLTRPSTSDRRVKEALLSDAGSERIRQALPHWQKAQEEFLAGFGADAWEGTFGALNKVLEVVPGTIHSA